MCACACRGSMCDLDPPATSSPGQPAQRRRTAHVRAFPKANSPSPPSAFNASSNKRKPPCPRSFPS